MKLLRWVELLGGLALVYLFFQPYVTIGGVGLPGYKVRGKVQGVYGFASRFSKRTDITIGYYAAPLVYSVPVVGAFVAFLAYRDRSRAEADLLAAAVAAAMVGYLHWKVSGKPFCKVGDGAWLSLIPGGLLLTAGLARGGLIAWSAFGGAGAPPPGTLPPPVPRSAPPPIPRARS